LTDGRTSAARTSLTAPGGRIPVEVEPLLPIFVIIGAMKCATTSLHYYLDQHPEIFMSRQKELDFFVAERQWSNGLAWYESCFSQDFAVNGESSTAYSKYPLISDVPARMHGVIPDAKLIYLVRDPIERLVSHYIHEYAQGQERRPLAEAVNGPGSNPYLDFSRYFLQLSQFLQFYPREQILIVETEDLRVHRRTTLQRIFAFLEVEQRFSSDKFDAMLNESGHKRRKNQMAHLLSRLSVRHYRMHTWPGTGVIRMLTGSNFQRPTIDPSLREQLLERLLPDTTALRDFTGLRFDRWVP
jgi:hypothetical protein